MRLTVTHFFYTLALLLLALGAPAPLTAQTERSADQIVQAWRDSQVATSAFEEAVERLTVSIASPRGTRQYRVVNRLSRTEDTPFWSRERRSIDVTEDGGGMRERRPPPRRGRRRGAPPPRRDDRPPPRELPPPVRDLLGPQPVASALLLLGTPVALDATRIDGQPASRITLAFPNRPNVVEAQVWFSTDPQPRLIRSRLIVLGPRDGYERELNTDYERIDGTDRPIRLTIDSLLLFRRRLRTFTAKLALEATYEW
ncbi:MAG: hypothetical protein AAGI08_18440 [Bacteroidota bacterium]